MAGKIFVSYSRAEGEWVRRDLVPCLVAAGAEVFVDTELFEAGRGLVGQMDGAQERADISLLVLSPGYLASPYCVHELENAVRRDPEFRRGSVVPVVRAECPIPEALGRGDLLYVDLRDDKDAAQWGLLLKSCGLDLGGPAPDWLRTRDALVRYLERRESVNLVVTGKPKWAELVAHLQGAYFNDMGVVDLDRGATAPRSGLVAQILSACGAPASVPAEPQDLVVLDSALSARPLSRLALLHLDHVAHRSNYGVDLFSTLRYLVMESRKLVLLAQSRRPFIELLPHDHPFSNITIQTVEMKGK